MNTIYTSKELLATLKNYIGNLEDTMADLCGMVIHRSSEGFSQEQLYDIAGRNDYVCTLTLRLNSDSYMLFGDQITCAFVYSLKERKALESNKAILNDIPNIRVKNLSFDFDKTKADVLLKDGIATRDIVEVLVLPYGNECNTFPSKELRQPKVMEIPFETKGNGEDIYWMYGALSKFKEQQIGLSPDEEAQYLAYKLIIEPDKISNEERTRVFDSEGAICDKRVAFHYLLWKKEAHRISETELTNLTKLRQVRFDERLKATDKALTDMGLSMVKFTEKYPEKAKLLLNHIISFHEKNFNHVGKYPLYMNFDSFLHIYLRHVEELKVDNQFAERDKFQVAEKDIFTVMNIVMDVVNTDYQKYKAANADKRFYRNGKMSYYYNGDYYCIDVLPNGCISTFYRSFGK